MKFNKAGLFLLIAVLSVVSGCGFQTIPPGSVGIIVNQWGSKRGVQDYTISSGRVTYNPVTSSVVEYPTSMQTVQWTKDVKEGAPQDESITFTTKESMAVNADMSLSYQLDQEKIPNFYVKFRNDDLKAFTYGFLHNIARDAMTEIGGKYTVEQVMGDNEAFLHEVRDRIQGQVKDVGVNLQQFGFIGAPRPPQQVVERINSAQEAKYGALQKQNELAQTQADAAKQVAQAEGAAKAHVAAAEGEAQANLKLAQSITPNLLAWRSLELQDSWIKRWNGSTPTMMMGGDGKSNLLLQLPRVAAGN